MISTNRKCVLIVMVSGRIGEKRCRLLDEIKRLVVDGLKMRIHYAQQLNAR